MKSRKSLPDLELTMREVGMLVLLAALSEPDHKLTDADLLAVHYKAKAYVEVNGTHASLSATISVRPSR